MNRDLEKISYEWLEVKKLSVKPSTYEKYRSIAENHVIPFFKKHKDFSNKDVINFFNNFREMNFKGSTIKIIKTVFKNILMYAEKMYGYKHVDLSYIKICCEFTTSSPLSEEEENRVSNYIFNNRNTISIAMALGLYAGLRIGEVCALKWEDVDLNKGIIYVKGTAERIKLYNNSDRKTELTLLEPKTLNSKREVYIADFFLNILKQYDRNFTYVITHRDRMMDPRSIDYQFKKICEEAHFHQLRHTFATNCVKSNVDIKIISELLGHSNVNITLNRYVHTNNDFKKKEINKLQFIDCSKHNNNKNFREISFPRKL